MSKISEYSPEENQISDLTANIYVFEQIYHKITIQWLATAATLAGTHFLPFLFFFCGVCVQGQGDWLILNKKPTGDRESREAWVFQSRNKKEIWRLQLSTYTALGISYWPGWTIVCCFYMLFYVPGFSCGTWVLQLQHMGSSGRFPGGGVVKNPPATAGDTRQTLHPWVGKIPWSRKWQTTPVFLPGKFHGEKESGRLQLIGSLRVGRDWATKHTHMGSSSQKKESKR